MTPTFPTHHYPHIPEVLNPLNPRHYALLLLWIYFQPSKLKQYLYRADPDLYQQEGDAVVVRALRLPAYRNLYVMTPLLTLVISTLIAVPIAGITSYIQGTPVEWVGVAFGVAVGMAVSVAVGVAFGVAGGVAVGVAGGVAFGVAFSVAGDVAGGVAFSVALGVAGRVALGVAGRVALGVAVGVVVSVVVGVALGVAGSVALGVGATRLIFFVLALPFLPNTTRHPLKWHPVLGDELAVWPLPGAATFLYRALQTDWEQGLLWVRQVMTNPFQQWAAQRALHDFFSRHPHPLTQLYQMAYWPGMDVYLIEPLRPWEFKQFPPVRLVILSELAGQFVYVSGDNTDSSERFVWRITRRLRRQGETPITRFSGLLYEIFRDETDLETRPLAEINTTSWIDLYEGVRVLPQGTEIADTFALITALLACQTMEEVTSQQHTTLLESSTGPDAPPPIRPGVVESLKGLLDVSRQVAAFTHSTSLNQQTIALNLAAGALAELEQFVQEKAERPERVLLKRIVGSWQGMVAQAQGALGQAALQGLTRAEQRQFAPIDRQATLWQRPPAPLDNPYVVGDPVYPPLLAGRLDIFNKISEEWAAKENPNSLILYGHRRMGKSSILRNLHLAAPPGSLLVYADLAGETSFVASTADLLLGLAEKMYRAASRAFPAASLPEPTPADYTTPARAQFQLNRLITQVQGQLSPGQTLILALDEFEALERAVQGGKIDTDIFHYLRSKTQEPGITLVFGGLHTLQEMSRDYYQPFYSSYTNIHVSYLSPTDAWRLITNPTPAFKLNYEPAAVERVIQETGGQPYLVQLLCRDALDHLNHQLFDLNLKREIKIMLADVEAVLGEPLFQHGTGYFDGVWAQTQNEGQRALLRRVAGRGEGWTVDELQVAMRLTPDELQAALSWAARHDILRQGPGGWQFCVPLMRAWVGRK